MIVIRLQGAAVSYERGTSDLVGAERAATAADIDSCTI